MIERVTENVFKQGGEILPWFTLPCLEWLVSIDLSDKNILEFGSGNSTAWFAKRCNRIVSIEANREWYNTTLKLTAFNKNVSVLLREVNEGDQSRRDYYCDAADNLNLTFDVVIVDGILRYECLQKGIEVLSKRGGIIIADNWQQSYIWMCDACVELMKRFKKTIYEQIDHKDNDGINKWKTAVFQIPKSK